MGLPPPFLDAVRRDLPADTLSVEAADLVEYGRDWTRVFAPAPSAIALPRTTAEVARLLALCTAHQIPVVPSGGRTGLAGGAVAAHGELVLSLGRMRRIDPVDVLGATVRVQAGAVTQAVHEHCRAAGLTWPVDFASKGSSTVGGNIATNAGGVKVIRYGLTRQWVLGLQVVTAAGHVLEVGGALEKNNTGVDLRQLWIGSEGILGVVTEATLKLARLPGRLDVLLFAVADVPAVLRLFRATRQAPFSLMAFEFFTDRCLARLGRHRGLASPFPAAHGAYVLVELEDAPEAALETWLASLAGDGLCDDAVLARSPSQAAALWALREGISESLAATGLPHKNDVALPVASLEAFCADLARALGERYPGFEIALFGHIGDGNLHVNVMKPDAMDKAEFLRHAHEADRIVFELVRSHAGSISAEHGIGLLKKDWLGYTRSVEEIALMRALKRTLDPIGILNPGKVFDP